MKNYKQLMACVLASFCTLAVCTSCSGSVKKDPDYPIRVISYNVLVDWCTEYEGSNTGETKYYDYTSRIKSLIEVLQKEAPDSFGVQEGSYPIKRDLLAGLADYDCVGVMDTGGPEDPNAFGTFIFYRKDRYKVVETKNFWLTGTPDKVSTYPGADRPRNGAWAILENLETGAQYAHVNVHLEWKTKESNSFGAKYTRKVVNELAEKDIPVFCTGDFNIESDTYDTVEIMTKESDGAVSVQDAQVVAKKEDGSKYTHFDLLERKIDFCFVTDERIEVGNYRLIGDYTISDHKGVCIDAKIK